MEVDDGDGMALKIDEGEDAMDDYSDSSKFKLMSLQTSVLRLMMKMMIRLTPDGKALQALAPRIRFTA